MSPSDLRDAHRRAGAGCDVCQGSMGTLTIPCFIQSIRTDRLGSARHLL